MGEKKKNTMLIEINERVCEVHPSFKVKMATQLQEHGDRLLQEDIKNCVCMFFIHEGEVKFDDNGDGYLTGDIINGNNFGVRSTVRWTSPMRKNIYPKEDVEDIEITFSWCSDFPLESLKNSSKKISPKVDYETYPFRVEYYGNIGPDIILGIFMAKHEGDNIKELLIDTLSGSIGEWNCKAKNQCIHYIGELMKKEEKYSIHIDFGNCSMEALEFVISSLAIKFGKSVSKVTIE